MITRTSDLTLKHIVEGVNTYIKSLCTEDSVIRLKDLVPIDDHHLMIDHKPILLLLHHG